MRMNRFIAQLELVVLIICTQDKEGGMHKSKVYKYTITIIVVLIVVNFGYNCSSFGVSDSDSKRTACNSKHA